MLRLPAILLFLSAIASQASAQTLAEYVSLRKRFGITQAVGIEALESFVGERVMEIQGLVRGSFSTNGTTTYLLERPDETTLEVDSSFQVEWMGGGEIQARLLVKARRSAENGRLDADLLGAAPEAEIARLERIERAKRPAVKPTPRSGAKPPLTGPIGTGPKTSLPKNWNLPVYEALPHYAGFIRKYNKRLTDAQAVEIATGILGFSVKYGVDARLIMAMVLVESGFNPNSRSSAGAMGLGQLMPGTAAGMGLSNAYDTMQNLYATTRLVRGKIDKYSKRTNDPFHALILALADYNAGSGTVRRHGYTVPPYRETQNYIQKVIATYRGFLGR